MLFRSGLKDYVKIHVEGEPRPVLSLMSLKSLEQRLPADRFVRVHRSFIVQPALIRTIERNRIVLVGNRVGIRVSFFRAARSRFCADGKGKVRKFFRRSRFGCFV